MVLKAKSSPSVVAIGWVQGITQDAGRSEEGPGPSTSGHYAYNI